VITNNGMGEAVLIHIDEYAEFEEYAHRRCVAAKLAEAVPLSSSHVYCIWKAKGGSLDSGACFISSVIRFALDFFVHFAGFEGEYSKYLIDKRVKWAEKDDVKAVTLLVKQARER